MTPAGKAAMIIGAHDTLLIVFLSFQGMTNIEFSIALLVLSVPSILAFEGLRRIYKGYR